MIIELSLIHGYEDVIGQSCSSVAKYAPSRGAGIASAAVNMHHHRSCGAVVVLPAEFRKPPNVVASHQILRTCDRLPSTVCSVVIL
jgi:hypothetical protein